MIRPEATSATPSTYGLDFTFGNNIGPDGNLDIEQYAEKSSRSAE